MLHTVLASFEDSTRVNCVDFFVRIDGTYGFETYRSDLDKGNGWNSLGMYSHLIFHTGEDAFNEAKLQVAWLPQSAQWRW